MSTNAGANDDTRDEAEADVQGHSLPIAQGLSALSRGRGKEKPGRGTGEDSLPALTKPFPRLKEPRSR